MILHWWSRHHMKDQNNRKGGVPFEHCVSVTPKSLHLSTPVSSSRPVAWWCQGSGSPGCRGCGQFCRGSKIKNGVDGPSIAACAPQIGTTHLTVSQIVTTAVHFIPTSYSCFCTFTHSAPVNTSQAKPLALLFYCPSAPPLPS